MAKKPYSKLRARALKEGYRSGLEEDTARYLTEKGVWYTYEEKKLSWVDLRYRKYTPDFILHNGIIVETKGMFTNDDRRKHIAIKEQYPDLDLRFVFTNSRAKLYKGSKTTYADWCKKHGFLYADKIIPDDWLE